MNDPAGPSAAPSAVSSRPAPERSSWTGGQYSLVRGIAGTAMAAWLAGAALHELFAAPGIEVAVPAPAAWPAVGLAMAGAIAALLFAAGAGDRISAVTVVASGTLLAASGVTEVGPGLMALAGVFLAHLLTPPAPYGSWTARGRPDPGGGWTPGRFWSLAVWGALAIAQATAAVRAMAAARPTTAAAALPDAAPLDAGPAGPWWAAVVMLALAFAIAAAAAVPRLRAGVFAAAGPLYAAWLVVTIVQPGCACEPAAFLVALLFAFDPVWVAGRRDATPATIFYDGDCGLCHRAVRFVVAEDGLGTLFRFAPLQGAEIGRRLDEARRRDLPDSIVVLASDGRVLMRAGAVRTVLAALGGLWTIAGGLGALVPDTLGDALYDLVARWRKRLFAAPRDRCPVTPPGLRGRFTLD